jgi:hypothetical protein
MVTGFAWWVLHALTIPAGLQLKPAKRSRCRHAVGNARACRRWLIRQAGTQDRIFSPRRLQW